MRPMRPSIMSAGAMMSQPASACTSDCFHQCVERRVVEDPAAVHQSVMAVAGVGIERHVAHDADFGHRLADGAHRLAHEIVRVEGFARVCPCAGPLGVSGNSATAGMPEVGGFRPLCPVRRSTE